MSIMHCTECDRDIDTDFDVEAIATWEPCVCTTCKPTGVWESVEQPSFVTLAIDTAVDDIGVYIDGIHGISDDAAHDIRLALETLRAELHKTVTEAIEEEE